MIGDNDASPAATAGKEQTRLEGLEELVQATSGVEDLHASFKKLVARIIKEGEKADSLGNIKVVRLLGSYKTIALEIEAEILQCLMLEEPFPEDIDLNAACALIIAS